MAVELAVQSHRSISRAVMQEVRSYQPEVLIVGARNRIGQGRYTFGRHLDPVIQGVPCRVVVIRGDVDRGIQRVLVPAAGGPNAPEAFEIARALAPDGQITTLYVALESRGPVGRLVGHDRLKALLDRLPLEQLGQIATKVVTAPTVTEGILQEAGQGYDLVIVGAGGENLVGRFLFGSIPQTVLSQSPSAAMIVRQRLGHLDSFWRRLWVHVFGLVPHLSVQEQAEIQKVVRRGSRPSPDFYITLTLAAGLASLGLLMNSPTIVIGAMLVAPLMTAILGMGFAVVLGDLRFLWGAAATALRGMVLAILMGLAVSLIVPGSVVTDAIRSTAQPSLFDLVVALLAGAAAAYALCRHDVSAALVGVAVAGSLTPPLTTVGIGISLGDLSIAWGAGLMFMANLAAIVAASATVFLLLGFRPQAGSRHRFLVLQRGYWSFALLLGLIAIPLVGLTRQSLSEVHRTGEIERVLRAELRRYPGSELVTWMYSVGDEGTLQIEATVRLPVALDHAQAVHLQEQVAQRLEQSVALSLSMVPTQRLQAYDPPTPTNTPSPTPTGLPSPTATPTSTSTPVPTLTPTASPTPTPIPTLTPLPTSAPTPTPWVAQVTGVDTAGLRVRYSPAGVIMGRLPAGSSVVILDGPVEAGGQIWYQVISLTERLEGWVVGEYLDLAPPP